MERLVASIPHTGNKYDEGNKNVLNILKDMVNITSFEYPIKKYQKARNVRAVYNASCLHNLGIYKRDKIIEDDYTYVMKR